MVRGFCMGSATTETSLPMTAYSLSTQAGGSSGTVGLTNTVLEVEGISEVEATCPSLVLSVGLFWIDSIWVSFSSVNLSIYYYASNSCSSRSVTLISIVHLSVFNPLVPAHVVGVSPLASRTLHRVLCMPLLVLPLLHRCSLSSMIATPQILHELLPRPETFNPYLGSFLLQIP
jgi:hypothetical protein